MKESELEAYLVQQVRRIGGMALKWSSPSTRGVPDRIVFLPGGIVPIFVEMKAGKGRVSPIQKRMHAKLAGFGHQTHVLNSKEVVNDFVVACLELMQGVKTARSNLTASEQSEHPDEKRG